MHCPFQYKHPYIHIIFIVCLNYNVKIQRDEMNEGIVKSKCHKLCDIFNLDTNSTTYCALIVRYRNLFLLSL